MTCFKFIFVLTALFTRSFVVSSCNNNGTSDKEYNSTYVCPMHCEGSGSDQTSKCPVCGMDYIKNSYYCCSVHPEITGAKGNKCSRCKSDLVPAKADDKSK